MPFKKICYVNLIRLYWKTVPLLAVAKVLYYVIVAVIPTFTIFANAKFVDTALAVASGGAEIQDIILPLGLIVLVIFFQYFADIGAKLLNLRASNQLRERLIPMIIERKASIKYSYYESQTCLDTINRATNEFEQVPQNFFDHAFEMVRIIATFTGLVAVLGLQRWWIAVLFVVTFIPSLIISYKFGKKSYDVERDLTRVERKVEYLSGVLNGRDTVDERYIYGYTSRLDEEYGKNYECARVARKKVDKLWWVNIKLSSIWTLITGLVAIASLIPLVISTDENRISIGLFTSVVTAIMSMSMTMQERVSDWIKDYKEKQEYVKELKVFWAYECNSDACAPPAENIPVLHSIEFKNVCFRYPGCEQEILHHFNLSLSAGKHYAIVGVNGAGKTTLIKLLTGLYDTYDGSILINGRELRTYTSAERKALIAVAYQDFCRYPLDLYDNIAIGNICQMWRADKVERAVEQLGLINIVEQLPEKLHTPINKLEQGGVDLSGGEWQRIALARLKVNPAPVKILDEPTAALDSVTENKIYERFSEIMDKSNPTDGITIFISHRLASTKLADEIIVISGGSIVEKGSFDELLAQNGIFAEMFRCQAELYAEQTSDKGGD